MAKTLEEILLTRIEPTGFCWLWKGNITVQGYGTQHFESRTWTAHRLVYTALVGAIPAGLHLDHLCRVHNCVNPDHLEPVTPAENNRRRKPTESWQHLKWRDPQRTKTHCSNGHDLSEVGTYAYPQKRGTYIRCKKCVATRQCKTRHRATGCTKSCKVQAYPLQTYPR
jgi:hypothetical protein